MLRRGLQWRVLAVSLGSMLFAGACEEPTESILVQSTELTVHNQTRQEWHDVEIWVNDHYRVVVKSIPPDQRLRVPLNGFVAWQGQRFDTRRQTVFGVEVTARTADGKGVTVAWGKGRRR